MPSTVPVLNLIVLRFPDIEAAARFYSALGMAFTKHAHGKGPEHYAADLAGLTLELYPQKSPDAATTHVRLGFRVADLEATVAALCALGAKVVTEPSDSPWGRRAVIDDLVGHRMELLAAQG